MFVFCFVLFCLLFLLQFVLTKREVGFVLENITQKNGLKKKGGQLTDSTPSQRVWQRFEL